MAEALRSLTAEKLKEALQADADSHKRCKTKVLDVAVQLLHQEIISAFSEALEGLEDPDEPCANGLGIEEDASTYHLCLSCVDMDQVPLQTRQAHVDFQKNVKCRANLTCTQCRRPLEIDLHWQELHRPIKAPAQVRKAYCAVLKDSKESSFLQALSLGMGLDQHCGVKERVLIHGPAVPAAFLEVLRLYWYLEPSRGSWLEVLNRNIIQDERLTMLRALSQTKYDKVLVLQLGIVVNSDLDDVFDVAGSAFVASQGRSRPTWPLMLLEPSNQALRRISMETAHPWQYPSFPPRQGAEQDEISTYLASFFRSFSKRDLQRLPSDFCSEALEGDARTFFCTENAWSRQKPGPPQGLNASLPSYSEVLASNFEMMAKVSQQRCVTCGFSDAMGKKDECDGRWRCRFCREHLLLQGAKDLDFQLPLPDNEVRDLRAKLKKLFLTGRQRWSWIAGKWQRGWLEFRPANVVWHSRHGVGTWHMWTDASGTTQLAVHLQHALEESGPQPYRQMPQMENWNLPKEEWRYTLACSGGSMPIFEETNRKVFRALGFAWEGSKSSNLGRIRLEPQSPVDPKDPEEAAKSPVNGSAKASLAAAAPIAVSSAGKSGDVRSRLSYLLKPQGAPSRSPAAPPTKAEPSATTAPSEVTPPKEPAKPPDAEAAEAAEAENLRTGDTGNTNGNKSLDPPVEVSASVETTKEGQQGSVPEAPEAPRSVREKLAYLLRK